MKPEILNSGLLINEDKIEIIFHCYTDNTLSFQIWFLYGKYGFVLRYNTIKIEGIKKIDNYCGIL